MWWRVSLTGVALGLLGTSLSGCGFQPLYAGAGANATVQGLSGVSVTPIPDRTGQVLTQALERELGFGPAAATTHRLDIVLSQTIEPFGIRSDESATRQRVTLAATYALVELATGTTVLRGDARSDVGIDRVRSEFATVTAEQTALERNAVQIARQIQNRLALHFRAGTPAR